MRFKYTSIAVAALAGLFFSACKKEGIGHNALVVPATYSFDNVDFSGQTLRAEMLSEIEAYMKTGNTSGTVLSAVQLKNMYSNSGSPFSNPALNNTTKQLKNKTYALDVALVESYFDSLAIASQSGVPGSQGVAGIVTNGSQSYLCGANGMEYRELVEKTLMGAVFMYQATDYYLDESGIGMSVDNTTVTPGEGTDMEHHWDEAFGYFTAPINFPTNTSGLDFWSKYANTVNSALQCNQPIMQAFLAGRAAISRHQHIVKENKANEIKMWWDKICAASAIHYLNSAITYFTDDARRNHTLSEAYGFIWSLKYNPSAQINSTDWQNLINTFGGNFYTITINQINTIKNSLSTIYGMDSIKNIL